MTLYGAQLDKDAIVKALSSGGVNKIKCLLDGKATKDNVLVNLQNLPTGPAVVYFSGHHEHPSGRVWPLGKFWTHDCYKKLEHEGPSRGISGNKFFQTLSEPGPPRTRLFLTDFCEADNVNRLCYMLEVVQGKVPQWVHVAGGHEREDTDKLLHFAACSPGQAAYESDQGGFFTRSLVKVIEQSLTLPELLTDVRFAHVLYSYNSASQEQSFNREGIRTLIDEHPPERGGCQIPQIYSSYPFDLADRFILEEFGLFY
ncbi:hypothetical protein FS749_007194 [Ceratobasidium sp. UAMH 11750]|nr:hypothetical protein FS749_007194 [Ceratobasidium sp. UAMH 11750]